MSYAEDRGTTVYSGLNAMAAAIYTWGVSKGFHSPAGVTTDDDIQQMCVKLLLVITELSEATEALRKGDESNFVEELADTVIRLLHICGAANIDIETAVEVKMLVNEKRPHKHGKKF